MNICVSSKRIAELKDIIGNYPSVRTKVIDTPLSDRTIGNFLIRKVLALRHRYSNFSYLITTFCTSFVINNGYDIFPNLSYLLDIFPVMTWKWSEDLKPRVHLMSVMLLRLRWGFHICNSANIRNQARSFHIWMSRLPYMAGTPSNNALCVLSHHIHSLHGIILHI